MSNIAAAPAPRTIPQNRSLGGRARTASAMTTALSPESRILIPMICRAANQKVGCIISDIKASTGRIPQVPHLLRRAGPEAFIHLLPVYKTLTEVLVAEKTAQRHRGRYPTISLSE